MTRLRALVCTLCAVHLVLVAVVEGAAVRTFPRHHNTTLRQGAPSIFVHLFEWSWNDIATECEQFLGPRGYSAVQVSPPQLHIGGDQWWTRYQPLGYQLESRSGNRDEFISMVNRCRDAGVGIYVDAVFNHMAAHDYNFPDVPFGPNDFHFPRCEITNYQDRDNVQRCNLVGLNDLDTEANYVQERIADYLNDLVNIGVTGLRFDAAKHMAAGDMAGILSRVNLDGVFVFSEVIFGFGEPIMPEEYVFLGDVTEFRYGDELGAIFKEGRSFGDLRNIGNNKLPSEAAVTFVDNHDTQRDKPFQVLTYKDGGLYTLANIFTLAFPYGYPKIMSSYQFDDRDQGPPGSGVHTGNSCQFDGGQWVCEHRWREIANMVEFANNAVEAWSVDNFWEDPFNNRRIAFGRGDRGFVVLNGADESVTVTLQTGMSTGTFCDVISDFEGGNCQSNFINVNVDGTAQFSVSGNYAAAIHVGSRIHKKDFVSIS